MFGKNNLTFVLSELEWWSSNAADRASQLVENSDLDRAQKSPVQ